ncbi:UDP-glucuronosyltransferase 1-10 isoform X2 [Folsomia candida]|uniref:UDP-glucuronosyltransferase 1-10 isoform X2 n=1 Tax=Folsomia candida TaxID=158441 RepID=UPI001604CFD9|nr:UDP-glucuronosyltransferase 1-10 isoform X2 [Folsomia candida]
MSRMRILRFMHVDTVGYHDEGSWIPDKIFHPDPPLTFWDRSIGLFVPLVYHFVREYLLFPNLEDIIRAKLCPNFLSGSDFERNNTNLVLVNGHYGEDFGRPLPPNVVSVGGMQCNRSRNERLPREIAEFLEGANNGFIYTSFGSFLQVDSLPKERVEMIMRTLKRVNNSKILLKMEKSQARRYNLPNSNIYTMDWTPQREILAHPKIRAFISHAGLLGIHEAICYAVPLLTFPMFGDQDSNADKVAGRKIGLKLEITTITGNQFMAAIKEVLTNKLYAENMARQSAIFRDRPSHPVDTAVWWTEYVLRHSDTSHLRPLSVHQPWWMKRHVDVWFCIFSSISISLTVSVLIFKIIMKALYIRYTRRRDIKESPKLKES